jgi:hypothetical protein
MRNGRFSDLDRSSCRCRSGLFHLYSFNRDDNAQFLFFRLYRSTEHFIEKSKFNNIYLLNNSNTNQYLKILKTSL